MLEQYSNIVKELYRLNTIGDYITQEQKIREYIKLVQKNKADDTREDLSAGYYWLARAIYKLNPNSYLTLREVIKYFQKSIKYCDDLNSEQMIKNCWLLASMQKKVYGDIKRKNNLSLYDRCEKYYRKRSPQGIEMADVLNNISNLTMDIEKIEESISIYKNLVKQKKANKRDIDGVYESAYWIYRYHNKSFHANVYLNKITSEDVVERINKQLNEIIA